MMKAWRCGNFHPGACVVRPQHACHPTARVRPTDVPHLGWAPCFTAHAPDRTLPQAIARHPCTRPMLAYEVGGTGSGQEAVRLGALLHHPGEPRPGASMGYRGPTTHAPGCVLPPNHDQKCIYELHIGQYSWRFMERPEGHTAWPAIPPPRGAPSRCPTQHGLPPLPRTQRDADCPVTMARHVSTCNTSVRMVGAIGSGRRADWCDPLTAAAAAAAAAATTGEVAADGRATAAAATAAPATAAAAGWAAAAARATASGGWAPRRGGPRARRVGRARRGWRRCAADGSGLPPLALGAAVS